ncbi:MAG: gamma-glutamylcyclotransferase [Planctomycetota bacterium]
MSVDTTLFVFVYGTLKSGGKYHDAYCKGILESKAAWVWGRLFDTGLGYPTIEIPQSSILADGSSDRARDSELSGVVIKPETVRVPSGFGRVQGELQTYSDFQSVLTRFDELEEFTPEGPSPYRRVLVPVYCEDFIVSAWTYVRTELLECTQEITDGIWRI